MHLGSLMKLLTLSHAFRTHVSKQRLPRRAHPLHHPAFAHDPLRDEVQTYAHWVLAWTTNRAYGSGEKRFIQFCLMNRLMSSEGDILPASERTLIYFPSYIARTVKHSTIKLYLSAVRNLHISCGHGNPLHGKLLLHEVLWGIVRYQGRSRILRQPVTPVVLAAIQPILSTWFGEQDFTMFWTAFTLAFFAFLRCSEFTCPGTNQFRPRFDLSTDCVSFHPSLASRSKCLFSSRLFRPTLIVKGTCLLLCAPLHRFAQLLL